MIPRLLKKKKKHLIFSCTWAWPEYKLDDKENLPTDWSINYNTLILQLNLFCCREGKDTEVPHEQVFFALRNKPSLCKQHKVDSALLGVLNTGGATTSNQVLSSEPSEKKRALPGGNWTLLLENLWLLGRSRAFIPHFQLLCFPCRQCQVEMVALECKFLLPFRTTNK